ncbi:hypothetical protein DPMN_089223 [Dreissena polymorpha]|uniref:Uncharacterized protein n=1 Tax=Dreissena polymorpha TaxID=45954 RepID=A0A9D4QX47_DREPO|nr:hypothetical protein DPMN_089223 [Dreissena polymorpha]
MSPEQQVRWLNEISLRSIDNLKINELSSVNELRDDLLVLNAEDDQLKAMKQEDIYKCPLCNRTYTCKQVSWFKNILLRNITGHSTLSAQMLKLQMQFNIFCSCHWFLKTPWTLTRWEMLSEY